MNAKSIKLLAGVTLCCVSTLIMSSCKPDDKKNYALEVMQFENYYRNAVHLYNEGTSYAYNVREVVIDPTNPQRSNKGEMIFDVINEIDNLARQRIKEIHELKIRMLEKLECTDAIGKWDLRNPRPAKIDGNQLQGDVEVEFYDIWVAVDIITFRTALFKKLSTSHLKTVDGKVKFDDSFKMDHINKTRLTDVSKDEKIIRKAIKNAHPDDKETLEAIFFALTPRKSEDVKYSAIEVLHYLCVQESRVLEARKMAFALLSSRISSSGFSFNEIVPLAYGPTNIKKGESFELKVLMAAFDSNNNPKISCDQGGVVSINEGVGSIQLKADKTTTYSGTIKLRSKSGVWHTKDWAVTVYVQP